MNRLLAHCLSGAGFYGVDNYLLVKQKQSRYEPLATITLPGRIENNESNPNRKP